MTMTVTVPTWFKQRQAKAEPAGDNALKVTGPNLHEGVVALRKSADGWIAAVKDRADGDDLRVSNPIADEAEAWAAAFELFRRQFII